MSYQCCICGTETTRDSETALCRSCAPKAEEFVDSLPYAAVNEEADCGEECAGLIVCDTNGSAHGDGSEIEKCDHCSVFSSDVAALEAVRADLTKFILSNKI